MASHILVVDDEQLIRWSLSERLKLDGYAVSEAADGAAACKLAEKGDIDLALLDYRLPDTDGLTLLSRLRTLTPDLPVIMVTAYSSVDGAVDAMKRGAVDYITKPFNMDELALTVRRTLDDTQTRRRLDRHILEQQQRFGLESLAGMSERFGEVKRLVERIARSESVSVLLLGETGVGKDRLARAIHYASPRAAKPFINITCTALPEALLESELFGHEKGAFTDAKAMKKGLFELAAGGSVYLDEIGDMSPGLQAKLLRVLEDKTFRRVGGVEDVNVDVRVIAATNRNIEQAIRDGRFREDLYYRLSTVPIVVPPLRERPEDIAALAAHFLKACDLEFHRAHAPLPDAVIGRLKTYHWPGNVRELRNVIERAALLSDTGEITLDDIVLGRSVLNPGAATTDPLVRLPENGCDIEQVEKELVRQALERTDGNRTRAAELLRISRDQVRYMVKKFGLE